MIGTTMVRHRMSSLILRMAVCKFGKSRIDSMEQRSVRKHVIAKEGKDIWLSEAEELLLARIRTACKASPFHPIGLCANRNPGI